MWQSREAGTTRVNWAPGPLSGRASYPDSLAVVNSHFVVGPQKVLYGRVLMKPVLLSSGGKQHFLLSQVLAALPSVLAIVNRGLLYNHWANL